MSGGCLYLPRIFALHHPRRAPRTMLNFAQPRRDFRVSRSLFSSVQAPRVARCSARGQRDAGRALSSSSASSSNCGSAPKLAREAQLSHLDTLLRRLAAGSVALAVVAGSLAPPAEARAESPAVSTVHQAARCQPQARCRVAPPPFCSLCPYEGNCHRLLERRGPSPLPKLRARGCCRPPAATC